MGIDLDRFEQLLKNKAGLQEIKADLGVKNKVSLQTAYGRLVAQKGKVIEPPDGLFARPGSGSGGRGVSSTVVNGKQGLRLSPKRMESLGCKVGDKFTPFKDGDNIILKPVS